MSCTPILTQTAFRGRNDNGNETTATWKSVGDNTNWSQAVDENFRVRFVVQESANCAAANRTFQLQYSLDGGTYTNVTGSSNVVRATASPNLADAANLTDQIGGTGTFVGATGFDEVDGAAGGSAMDMVGNGHAECEFCIQIRSADVTNGQTVQLKVTTTNLASWTQVPSITVQELTHYSLDCAAGSYAVTGAAATLLKPITDPSDITGLRVWLDAQTISSLNDGDAVATWSDLSGNGLDFTEATNRPVYKTNIYNGHPIVRFDGANDVMSNASVDMVQPVTIGMVVAHRTGSVAAGGEGVISGFNFRPCIYAQDATPDAWELYAGSSLLNTGVALSTSFVRIVAIANSTSSKSRVNGTEQTGDAGTGGATAKLQIGALMDAGNIAERWADCDIAEVVIYDGALSEGSMVSLEDYFTRHWAQGAYVLNAESGSYAISGAALTVLADRLINAAAGNYEITGAAAGLNKGFNMNAEAGTYGVTGAAATVLADRLINAAAASYEVTGAAATLARGYFIVAEAGSYIVTGAAATLLTDRLINAGAGEYVITGAAATLLADRLLNLEPGQYQIIGADATLVYAPAGAYVLNAEPGIYAISGAAAAVLADRLINAAPGQYIITGAEVTFVAPAGVNDGDEVQVTLGTGIQCYVVQATSIGVRVVISSAKQIYVTNESGTPVKVTI